MKNLKYLFMCLLGSTMLLVSCGDDDDGDNCTEATWYADADGDGFGDAANSTSACAQPTGFVANSTDCNDADAAANAEQMWFEDTDGDGFGSDTTTQMSCGQPAGFSNQGGDCDDTEATTFPGATEDPNDGVDSACDGGDEIIIWSGADLSFNKPSNADWTDPANQDILTSLVTFTRQDQGQMYNYQWWPDNGLNDPSSNDLFANFWNGPGDQTFTPNGGTQGVRWAILDDTGSDNPWDAGFALYGTLGDPTHFYSFHNIASLIRALNDGENPASVTDEFSIDSPNTTGTVMPELVGKNLGVWLVDEDIYLTLSFTEWGSGGSGGALGYTRSTPQ